MDLRPTKSSIAYSYSNRHLLVLKEGSINLPDAGNSLVIYSAQFVGLSLKNCQTKVGTSGSREIRVQGCQADELE